MDQPSHIEDAAKGLRNEAQEVSEQALGRLEPTWEDTLTSIEEYLASRPWLVFGAFCAGGSHDNFAQRCNRLISLDFMRTCSLIPGHTCHRHRPAPNRHWC